MTLLESLHTVGLAVMVYAALPELDSVRGLMLTNCVCLVPAVLGKLLASGGFRMCPLIGRIVVGNVTKR